MVDGGGDVTTTASITRAEWTRWEGCKGREEKKVVVVVV
jgi:hypothetical protein